MLEILEAVRDVYRETFAPIIDVLLSSQNFMLPDDHDILNNFGARHANNASLAPFVKAALTCYYEYQHILRMDIDVPDLVEKHVFDAHGKKK